MSKETITYENLRAGNSVPFLTEQMILVAEDYAEGDLLEIDETTNILKKLTVDAPGKFYGVIAEDKTLTTSGLATVYVSGIFFQAGVKTETGVAIDTALKVQARKLNIYFK